MTPTLSGSADLAALERKQYEAELMAESALHGERAISILRIVTWVLLGFAFSAEAIDGKVDEGEHGALHGALIGGWFLFAVVAAIALRRVHFTPRRALLWPLLFIAVDFGCFICLEFTTHDDPRPELSFATLAILVTFSVARFSSVHVWTSAAIASAGLVGEALTQGWFRKGPMTVMLASFLCLALVVVWANRRVRRMFVDLRRRENLVRLLPRQVADRVLAAGGKPLAPVQREVTILFSDIRDFTTLSQRMDPGEVLTLLDAYFARMTSIVKGHDGMVNKLLGDGMLAIWGVPDPMADHAVRAVAAALDMQRAVKELNAGRVAGAPELRIGIGIHTGVVAAGMLGGADQHEYTVIGDAVNLASRIEGLTKKAGAALLVSESTWSKCGGKFAGSLVGSEPVKGRDEPVKVFRVEGPGEPVVELAG